MDGNGIAAIVASADSGWAIAAIFLIGSFGLLWKFGNDILGLLKENNRMTQAAQLQTEHISHSIITNHGSKNLGDAIDRLTGEVWRIRDEQTSMRSELTEHIANSNN